VSAQRAPAAVPTNLSPDILSLACAPGLAYEAPPTPLRVTGSQESFVRRTFAPGDLIVVNGGTDNGIDVGQEYFTRRAVPVELGEAVAVEVRPDSSTLQVTVSRDAFIAGDYVALRK
jgi:hypothetical protein